MSSEGLRDLTKGCWHTPNPTINRPSPNADSPLAELVLDGCAALVEVDLSGCRRLTDAPVVELAKASGARLEVLACRDDVTHQDLLS